MELFPCYPIINFRKKSKININPASAVPLLLPNSESPGDGGWNDKTPNLQVLRHSSESSQPPDRGEVKFVSAGRMARQPRHKHEQHH